jgi:beta-xylosidase
VIEAVMLWNEPNNASHWDFDLDPDWALYASMVRLASAAVRAESSSVTRLLGGISPIDPGFLANMDRRGVLSAVDAVALHGFPFDWNHWPIDAWPAQLASVREVTSKPLWITEVGASSFGAEEVQELGLRLTATLLRDQVARIHWYSLLDLPRAWPATTRHREAEGSSYYRHFYMGLVREDGTPKRALRLFQELTPDLGVCQWFHFEDPRLDLAMSWLDRLGVKRLRTGLSWADSLRPGALAWFDRQMKAIERFDVTLTFGYTPESRGLAPHHTSPPARVEEYADFCAAMTRRYAR